MQETNITIIGAGVIGLAIAYKLFDSDKNIVVIDKEDSFGRATSSRNSEVIHAGLYYEPNSLKAKTCIKGRELLYELCAKNNIPHKKLGKLVVAANDEEVERIEDIHENAERSGVKDLRFLEQDEISRLEPNIKGKRAIFSPDTGIIDSHSLMDFFYQKSKTAGVMFAFSSEVVGIKKAGSEYQITIKDPTGDLFYFDSDKVINSAGLGSDKIAQLVGIDIEKQNYKLHYCKGQYFRLRNPKKFSINHLIYPPATKIDLGIHITPDLAGGLRLGPDARYVSDINYDINENDKKTFYESVKKLLPNLGLDDLISDTAGIRPKLQKEDDDFRDFVIKEESELGLSGFINLIGIESPGLTSCLAIADVVKKILDK